MVSPTFHRQIIKVNMLKIVKNIILKFKPKHLILSYYCNKMASELRLGEVVAKLNAFAPEALAESWDNVGLLIEPSDRLMESWDFQIYLNFSN